jgi:DNA-binding MarR family transcriptional regulator
MVEQHTYLVDQAVEAYQASWIALRQTAEEYWAQLELTAPQLKALILLEIRRQMTIGQIATMMNIGRPSASILIEQMVQLRLVVRTEDPADRRRTLVCLTRHGADLAAKLHRGDEDTMRQWFDRICNEDLSALSRGMRALAEAIPPPVVGQDE